MDVALDGAAALRRASLVDYDAVVLDRDLPQVHGDEVCRTLIAAPHPPRILMLTAAAEVSDRVEGLDLGADDYLVKPFAFEEVLARLRAAGCRPERPPRPCWSAAACAWIRRAARSTATGRRSR